MNVIAIKKPIRPVKYPLGRNTRYNASEGGKHLTRWHVFKMWVYRKIYLPFLYGVVLYSGKPDYDDTCCPLCGWDTCTTGSDWWIEATTNYYSNSDGYESWTTHYLCPQCGTQFFTEDSN